MPTATAGTQAILRRILRQHVLQNRRTLSTPRHSIQDDLGFFSIQTSEDLGPPAEFNGGVI